MTSAWTRTPWILLALSLAACGSAPTEPAPAPRASAVMTPPPAAAPAPPPPMQRPMPESTVATVSLPEHLNAKSLIATQRSIFFDFDVYTIRGDDLPLVERHGRYLAQHPELRIRIEGNSDERGGTEYNLALGQKRAMAVQRALRLYGVQDRQMEAVSWGESKPLAPGHDEAAWAQNRRADLQYPMR